MYTPTTAVVRTDYIRTQFTDVDKAGEEFDRWLAEVKREVWDEAVNAVISTVRCDSEDITWYNSNPYRREGAADHD